MRQWLAPSRPPRRPPTLPSRWAVRMATLRSPDLTTRVGSLTLPNPVMTASGTSGHGAELACYLDLSSLGAVVVKSVAPWPWGGNDAPRLVASGGPGSMLNSVGLQGPGVQAWLEADLPPLVAAGARVVASIWGRTVEDYGTASSLLAGAPPQVVAVEVNLSCPNVEDRRHMFARSASATSEAVGAVVAAGPGRPVWAKLSPSVADLEEVAGAALSAGAEALTLVNTLLGMAIDTEARRPVLGAGGGGLSGPALHPVAVRAVYECRAAFPAAPIVGSGGVASGEDAVELLMAGASAVQVGTATLADPRAPARVLRQLRRWCRHHGVRKVSELVGAAHG
jgi:dihydroorotate dehydrogenase (NAD+) catalytic subunit